MAKRFGDILKAPRLQTAYTRYQAWKDAQATRPANVGGGTSRGTPVRVAVLPFGFDIGTTGDKAVVKVSRRANSLMSGSLGIHIASVLADDRVIAGFSPAKVILFQGTGSSVASTSEITGIRYLKRNGESYTHPFGRKAAVNLEIEALEEITNALLTGGANRTVSYKPEARRQV